MGSSPCSAALPGAHIVSGNIAGGNEKFTPTHGRGGGRGSRHPVFTRLLQQKIGRPGRSPALTCGAPVLLYRYDSLTDLLRRAALPACLLLTACGGGGGSSATDSGGTVGAGSVSTPPAVSWYSTAKPLIERYCVACHTEGGVAPFRCRPSRLSPNDQPWSMCWRRYHAAQGYANLLPGRQACCWIG